MIEHIRLSRGMVALVDGHLFDEINMNKWCFHHSGYAIRNTKVDGKNKQVSMHRIVLNAPEGTSVDHINGNRLDNRLENLRLCSHSENMQNRFAKHKKKYTQYKGVHFRKDRGCFYAEIQQRGNRKYLGSFNTEIEAAKAYDKAAVEVYGEFAKLNLGEKDGGLSD